MADKAARGSNWRRGRRVGAAGGDVAESQPSDGGEDDYRYRRPTDTFLAVNGKYLRDRRVSSRDWDWIQCTCSHVTMALIGSRRGHLENLETMKMLIAS